MNSSSPLRFHCLLRLACWVISILATTEAARGEVKGVVIYKANPAIPDSNAQLFEFASFADLGEIKRFTSETGGRLDLDPFKPHVPVPYPAPPETRIVGPDQLDALATEIDTYTRVMARYPGSKKLLTPKLEFAQKIQQRVKDGEVYFKGQWLSAATFREMEQKRLRELKNDFDDRTTKRRDEIEAKRRTELEEARHKR